MILVKYSIIVNLEYEVRLGRTKIVFLIISVSLCILSIIVCYVFNFFHCILSLLYKEKENTIDCNWCNDNFRTSTWHTVNLIQTSENFEQG